MNLQQVLKDVNTHLISRESHCRLTLLQKLDEKVGNDDVYMTHIFINRINFGRVKELAKKTIFDVEPNAFMKALEYHVDEAEKRCIRTMTNVLISKMGMGDYTLRFKVEFDEDLFIPKLIKHFKNQEVKLTPSLPSEFHLAELEIELQRQQLYKNILLQVGFISDESIKFNTRTNISREPNNELVAVVNCYVHDAFLFRNPDLINNRLFEDFADWYSRTTAMNEETHKSILQHKYGHLGEIKRVEFECRVSNILLIKKKDISTDMKIRRLKDMYTALYG